MMSAERMVFVVAAVAASLSVLSLCAGAPRESKLTLSYRQVPRQGREGKTTPKLDVDRADVGPVCELQCYETGPFQTGDAVKKEDGSVVFSYQSGNMTCVTTLTAQGDDRVQALTEIKGPLEELKSVRYLGACLQFQRSELFTRHGPLQEFANRCFIYTMRGPVTGLDTARGKMTNFQPDAPENNPPMVQWYLPIERMHPGDIWGVVGTAGDRPLYGLVACTSRDGKWVTAYAARHNLSIGQLYMPCIHVVPDVQKHLDEGAGTIRYKEMIYIMPNDPERLLQAFREDFAPAPMPFEASPAASGALLLAPTAQNVPPLKLTLKASGGNGDGGEDWKRTWWGTFIRSENSCRAWAHPHDNALELCVSFKADSYEAGNTRAVATLAGEGWTAVAPPEGTQAQVVRSADGKWTALLFWERADADDPSAGVPAFDQQASLLSARPMGRPDTGPSPAGGGEGPDKWSLPDDSVISVRGKIVFGPTESLDPAEQKSWADVDWEHAKPYRMPVDEEGP